VSEDDREQYTDEFRKATTTQEELENTNFVQLRTLPTTWKDGTTGHTIKGRGARVITPSGADIKSYGEGNMAVCGHCKYYDLESGRKELVRQRFGEMLVREHEWKLKHLGDVDTLALCGASGGETCVAFVSAACDQFRPRKR
jgi:hypothetical protein